MYNSKPIVDNSLSVPAQGTVLHPAGWAASGSGSSHWVVLALPLITTAQAAKDATGKPIITSAAWVDVSQSAETSDAGDPDGLDNATFTQRGLNHWTLSTDPS